MCLKEKRKSKMKGRYTSCCKVDRTAYFELETLKSVKGRLRYNFVLSSQDMGRHGSVYGN